MLLMIRIIPSVMNIITKYSLPTIEFATRYSTRYSDFWLQPYSNPTRSKKKTTRRCLFPVLFGTRYIYLSKLRMYLSKLSNVSVQRRYCLISAAGPQLTYSLLYLLGNREMYLSKLKMYLSKLF